MSIKILSLKKKTEKISTRRNPENGSTELKLDT